MPTSFFDAQGTLLGQVNETLVLPVGFEVSLDEGELFSSVSLFTVVSSRLDVRYAEFDASSDSTSTMEIILAPVTSDKFAPVASVTPAEPTEPTTGSWFTFGHNMGGDMIVVETHDADLADHFVCSLHDVNTLDELWFEDDDRGPLWHRNEGDLENGAFSQRPTPLEDRFGVRPDGPARTRWYTQDEALALIASKQS